MWPCRPWPTAAVAIAMAAMVLLATSIPASAAEEVERGVTVTRSTPGATGERSPCPALRRLPVARLESGNVDRNAPLLAGGCAIRMVGESNMDVLSVVEPFRFGRCTTELAMRVDGDGRVGVDYVKVGGMPPCNDVGLCYDADEDPRPLYGRIVADRDGRLRLRLRLCLDTCLGRFEGDIEGDVRRTANGPWRLEIASAPIGTSGWSLDDGRWRLGASRAIGIRAVESAPRSRASAAGPYWSLARTALGRLLWP